MRSPAVTVTSHYSIPMRMKNISSSMTLYEFLNLLNFLFYNKAWLLLLPARKRTADLPESYHFPYLLASNFQVCVSQGPNIYKDTKP